jgi:hypothetical protein
VPGGRGTRGTRVAGVALFALLLAITAGFIGPRADAGTGLLGLVRLGTFAQPVHVDNAPGFPHLLFVVEKRGTIAVLKDRRRLGLFLDIRGLVRNDSGERGLFSVAFPPNYQTSRRFYVYYTNQQGAIEIDEFRRRVGSPARANPASRRRVMVIPHPGEPNHYGGQLQFGPDGMLWAGTGDGGGPGDLHDNARSRTSLLGKLLRIDPLPEGARSYRSPPGNPYVGGPGRDEIYSYGLRNPWRFSFDSRSGRLAIADVGEHAAEEVNYETLASAKGANFGWPQWEGDVPHDLTRPGQDPPQSPIFTYRHPSCRAAGGGCSITGGYVVRDPGMPALAGRYIYADFFVGNIRSFIPTLTGARDVRGTGLHVSNLSSFGRGIKGRIYVASLNGPVYRLTQGR